MFVGLEFLNFLSELFIRESCNHFRSFVSRTKANETDEKGKSVKEREMTWSTNIYFQLQT